MNFQQLEFILEDKSEVEIKFEYLQKQVCQSQEIQRKSIKKQFMMMSDMAKLIFQLQEEINDMRNILRTVGYGKENWIYGERNNLFDVQKFNERKN